MIQLKNINKYFYKHKNNEIHVLNNLNLEFENSGLVTILGPSGSGKSTLLNVIGGLDRSTGQISFDDYYLKHTYGKQMDIYRNEAIGYIFQNYNLIPDLTVYENLKVQLDLIEIKDLDEINKRIDICLSIVGLEKYKRRNVTALSGGQQQRVAIARALVKGAKIIIADEPTGNLDSKSSIEVMNILKALSNRCLVILVTHNQNLAFHYSDRIIKIKDGEILEDSVNENDNTLLESDQNSIYLEQYEEQVLSTNHQQISLYSNSENISLRIIVDKNTIYIDNQTELDLKVLGQNTDKEIKDSYIEFEIDVTEINKNLNFTDYPKISLGKRFLNFFIVLKDAILRFLFAPKKTWFIHFSFFLIGILLCLCMSSISYSTSEDKSVLKDFQPNAVRVKGYTSTVDSKYGYSFEYQEIRDIIWDDNSGVTGVAVPVKEASILYYYLANRSVPLKFDHPCYVTTTEIFNYKEKLENNDIIISREIADDFISYFSNFGIHSYDDIIGKTFTIYLSGLYEGEVFIKGIEAFENYTFLVSDEVFFNGWKYATKVSGTMGIDYRVIEENETFENLTIVGDITQPYAVYMSRNLQKFLGDETLCVKVGFFDSENYEIVFLNRNHYNDFVTDKILPSNPQAGDVSPNVFPYENADIILESGTFPTDAITILLPDVLKGKYKIGSTFRVASNTYYIYYLVCGFFKSDYPLTAGYFYTNSRAAYTHNLKKIMDQNSTIYEEIDLYSNDYEKTISYFENLSYEAGLVKNYVLQESRTNKIDTSQIAIFISIAFAVVMVVFIFFISRSRMMHNIYTIGVYRALGARKGRIYRKYFLDSIILATFTCVLGFLLMYWFASYASQYVYGVNFSGYIALLVVLGIYALVILSSLLPIYLLMRKTPIEIIGKYDI